MNELRIIRAIVSQDLAIWLRRPAILAATILPSIGLFIATFIGASAVGRNQVALVQLDNGPHAQQMAQIINDYQAFVVHPVSADEAQSQLKDLVVEAVITIPANFDAAYDAHQPGPVTIQVNNLNLDFTNDLRRSLPAAITQYYAAQSNSPIDISVQEADLRTHDIDSLQFQIVPLLVLLLTSSGVVNSSLAVAREWEGKTIKELLLAPVARRTLVIAKILSGWLTTLLVGGALLLFAAITGYIRPQGLYWLPTLLVMAMIALSSVGIGVALGATVRRIQPSTALSTNIALYLFFLSGGLSVAAFLPGWVQTIAHFIPTFYGVHALQMAVFYGSTDQFPRDLLVLLVTVALTLTLGVRALNRRGLA